MNNQDNINGFLDSMDDFENVPAEQAPSAKSVPFTPAAVWPGEEQTAPQQVAAPPVQAETVQPEVPTQPVIQQAVGTPVPQVQPTVTAAPAVQPEPVIQQPPVQPVAEQQPMLDPFEAALKNAEQQSEKRMLEALAAKPAVFSYAKVRRKSRTGTQPLRICVKSMRRTFPSFRIRKPYHGR